MKLSRRKMLITAACGAIGGKLLTSEEQSSNHPAVNNTYSAAHSIVDFPKSKVIRGFEWLGPSVPYPETNKRGDTFPITWASDDNLYTSACDPEWPDKGSGFDFECLSGSAPNFTLTRPNAMPNFSGSGGAGLKSSGLISVGGTLYLAIQNVTGPGDHSGLPKDIYNAYADYGHGYDAHVIASSDFGLTWTVSSPKQIQTPMFPGRTFASSAFVNFGKDNAGALDKFVYAISGEGWDNGVHCRLGRVPHDQILNLASWQWVSAMNNGAPTWSSVMSQAVPVLTHPGYLGYVDMVYIAPLKRYLLLAWSNKVKADPDTGSELIIYDSPEPWGPFTLVYHEDPWESISLNPYNPRLPLKWFNPATLEGWMLYSGSWRKGGQTPTYRIHVRPFKLIHA
jgi:hypothetical protein